DVPIDPARAFDRQPVWKRTIVILAGVTMNAVFAFLIYSGLAATTGAPELASTEIDSVAAHALPPGTEALGRLRFGDRIGRANGGTLRSWSAVLHTVWNSPAKPVRFDVLRDGQIVQVTVVPESKVETDSASPRPPVYGAIGAAPNPPTIHVREPLGRALASGFQETWGRGQVVFGFLKGLVLRQTSFREVGGIITVGQI